MVPRCGELEERKKRRVRGGLLGEGVNCGLGGGSGGESFFHLSGRVNSGEEGAPDISITPLPRSAMSALTPHTFSSVPSAAPVLCQRITKTSLPNQPVVHLKGSLMFQSVAAWKWK